jgi:hypothetical protein
MDADAAVCIIETAVKKNPPSALKSTTPLRIVKPDPLK